MSSVGQHPNRWTAHALEKRGFENVSIEQTKPEDAIFGFYASDALSVALHDVGWSLGEEVRELTQIARDGNNVEKLAAIRQIRQVMREVLGVNGYMTQVSQVQTHENPDGSVDRQQVSTTLLGRIANERKHDDVDDAAHRREHHPVRRLADGEDRELVEEPGSLDDGPGGRNGHPGDGHPGTRAPVVPGSHELGDRAPGRDLRSGDGGAEAMGDPFGHPAPRNGQDEG